MGHRLSKRGLFCEWLCYEINSVRKKRVTIVTSGSVDAVGAGRGRHARSREIFVAKSPLGLRLQEIQNG
jgi:hypothetical protein